VAVAALVFAMAGSALAGSDASSRAITKSKVKSIAKKQINKAAPGLTVAKAGSADNATNATTAGIAGDVRTARSGTNILAFTANTDQTVQTVNLPAGVWFATAGVTGNNNSGSNEAYDCQLVVGGTEVDRTSDLAYPDQELQMGPASGDDREYIRLAGAARLATAGSADLICQTSSSSGNWLARSITAIQLAKLNGG
jgi:hypothetical protein